MASKPRPKLLTLPMVGLLLAVGLGWTAELLAQATVPLVVLDRGGDAATVGLVLAAYALPTLLLRPIIGRGIDRSGHGPTHQLGAALLFVGPLALAVAAIPAIVVGRLVQGLGWAMYGTANNVVLARLASVERRGEASAWFNIMWAVGFLVGPPLGLTLYAAAGPELPFLLGAAFGAAALVTVSALRPIVPPPAAPARAGKQEQAQPAAEMPHSSATRRLVGRLVEPAALPTMAILSTFMAGQALYLAFAPVYARSIGAPDEVLALYFPLFGAILALGQLVTGGVSDRFGRRATIIAGCGLGSLGLLVSAVAATWTTFALGAGAFALAAAIVNPAAAAATIDRAPAGRIGVTMATFSIGYQVAAGLGGAAWGLLIAGVGFPAPFLVAIGLQAVCAVVAIRYLQPLPRPAVAGVTSQSA